MWEGTCSDNKDFQQPEIYYEGGELSSSKFFKVKNLFSELSTRKAKERARKNLGVIDRLNLENFMFKVYSFVQETPIQDLDNPNRYILSEVPEKHSLSVYVNGILRNVEEGVKSFTLPWDLDEEDIIEVRYATSEVRVITDLPEEDVLEFFKDAYNIIEDGSGRVLTFNDIILRW